MADPSLPLTVHEYDEWGNPSDPRIAQAQAQYCPSTLLQAALREQRRGGSGGEPLQLLPSVLMTVGMQDPRVSPVACLRWARDLRSLVRQQQLRRQNQQLVLQQQEQERQQHQPPLLQRTLGPTARRGRDAAGSRPLSGGDDRVVAVAVDEEGGHFGHGGLYGRYQQHARDYAFLIARSGVVGDAAAVDGWVGARGAMRMRDEGARARTAWTVSGSHHRRKWLGGGARMQSVARWRTMSHCLRRTCRRRGGRARVSLGTVYSQPWRGWARSTN